MILLFSGCRETSWRVVRTTKMDGATMDGQVENHQADTNMSTRTDLNPNTPIQNIPIQTLPSRHARQGPRQKRNHPRGVSARLHVQQPRLRDCWRVFANVATAHRAPPRNVGLERSRETNDLTSRLAASRHTSHPLARKRGTEGPGQQRRHLAGRWCAYRAYMKALRCTMPDLQSLGPPRNTRRVQRPLRPLE